jgi:hypothetical protein
VEREGVPAEMGLMWTQREASVLQQPGRENQIMSKFTRAIVRLKTLIMTTSLVAASTGHVKSYEMSEFDQTGTSQQLIGCWKRNVSTDMVQDWCMKSDGTYTVFELADGHGANWSGEWEIRTDGRVEFMSHGNTSSALDCLLRFKKNFDAFVQTDCRGADGVKANDLGVFLRSSGGE